MEPDTCVCVCMCVSLFICCFVVLMQRFVLVAMCVWSLLNAPITLSFLKVVIDSVL